LLRIVRLEQAFDVQVRGNVGTEVLGRRMLVGGRRQEIDPRVHADDQLVVADAQAIAVA
jgi:hypothetical protein